MTDFSIKNRHLNNLRLFLIAMAICSLALLLRIDDLHFVTNSLWAEDGPVFIKQALQLGFKSILEPYAGYLHIYPRMTAIFVNFIPIAYIPYLFLAGWFVSLIILIYVIVSRSRLLNLNAAAIFFLVLAVVLLPHSGEVFFTLANCQWILGSAFILYLCVPENSSPRVSELFLLFIMALTGPFSLLMIPILILQLIMLKDFRVRKWVYMTVTAGALIQLLLITTSGSKRITNSFNLYTPQVTESLVNFFNLGSNSINIAIILFWSLLSILAIYKIFSINIKSHKHEKLILLSLALAIIIMFFSGLFAVRDNIISPMNNGSRYFVIPYILLFFLAVMLARIHKFILIGMLCLIGLIDSSAFIKYSRHNLQWEAFTKFSKIKPELMIPIHPEWPYYPGWQVNFSSENQLNSAEVSTSPPISLDLKLFSSVNAQLNRQDEPLIVLPTTPYPQLYFDIGKVCNQDKFIGMEIHSWHKQAGWTEIFWGQDKQFSQEHSLKRFYPEGDNIMQFAFERNAVDNWLRIDTPNNIGEIKLYKILVYCLSDIN